MTRRRPKHPLLEGKPWNVTSSATAQTRRACAGPRCRAALSIVVSFEECRSSRSRMATRKPTRSARSHTPCRLVAPTSAIPRKRRSSWRIVIVARECVGDRSQAPHEVNLFGIDAKYPDVVSKDEAITYVRSLVAGHVHQTGKG